jgi:hypothetical protein
MGVAIHMDASDWLAELHRLADGPDLHDLLRLEAVLTEQFELTQQYVHVITGSLRASGKIHSDMHGHLWEGEITYGGQSNAIIDPVNYARREQSRGVSDVIGVTGGGDEHGDHDFMRPLGGEQHGYLQAILAFLRGER